MRWLKKFPWISLSLLIVTYAVSGWLYAEWSQGIILKGRLWHWTMQPMIAATIIHGLAVLGIFAIASIVNTPFESLTMGLGSWLKSEAKAVMSIFLGAFAFALIVQRFHHFMRFLVLLAAFLLFKLDFQTAGYSEKISRIVLMLFSLGGFASGVTLFYSWGHFLSNK